MAPQQGAHLMSLESAIVARAAATPSLVTEISNRLFNAVAPANAARPHVVFDLIGGEGRERSMGDGVNMTRQRVQFSVISDSAVTEIAVHGALMTAFDWYQATISGTEIVNAYAEGSRQTIGAEAVLPDTRVTSQDFIFLYRE
jgi:hypothetical protein